jgi:hypothetical protein
VQYTCDQIFITLSQLRSCFPGAPFLTRGWACLLYMLLAIASVIFLGSESLGTRDHILLSQIFNLTRVQSYVTTDGQSASISWNKAHIWGFRPDLHLSDSCGFVDAGRSL